MPSERAPVGPTQWISPQRAAELSTYADWMEHCVTQAENSRPEARASRAYRPRWALWALIYLCRETGTDVPAPFAKEMPEFPPPEAQIVPGTDGTLAQRARRLIDEALRAHDEVRDDPFVSSTLHVAALTAAYAACSVDPSLFLPVAEAPIGNWEERTDLALVAVASMLASRAAPGSPCPAIFGETESTNYIISHPSVSPGRWPQWLCEAAWRRVADGPGVCHPDSMPMARALGHVYEYLFPMRRDLRTWLDVPAFVRKVTEHVIEAGWSGAASEPVRIHAKGGDLDGALALVDCLRRRAATDYTARLSDPAALALIEAGSPETITRIATALCAPVESPAAPAPRHVSSADARLAAIRALTTAGRHAGSLPLLWRAGDFAARDPDRRVLEHAPWPALATRGRPLAAIRSAVRRDSAAGPEPPSVA